MGEILGGTIKGFLTPPGGKREQIDKSFYETAHRELFEETGLIGVDERKVATVTINIKGTQRTLRIHVFKCTNWTGRLKVEEREFSYLRFFPFDEIPWDKLAPGDQLWLEPVLKGRTLGATITCGSSRTHVESVKIRKR